MWDVCRAAVEEMDDMDEDRRLLLKPWDMVSVMVGPVGPGASRDGITGESEQEGGRR